MKKLTISYTVLVRKKEGKVESLTLSEGQYYSENIFPQSKELAAKKAQIPLLSMLVPKRDFVHKNKIYLDEVHVDLENVPSQIISATEPSRLEKLTQSPILALQKSSDELKQGLIVSDGIRHNSES